jgi:AraC-like DNA-binding protein
MRSLDLFSQADSFDDVASPEGLVRESRYSVHGRVSSALAPYVHSVQMLHVDAGDRMTLHGVPLDLCLLAVCTGSKLSLSCRSEGADAVVCGPRSTAMVTLASGACSIAAALLTPMGYQTIVGELPVNVRDRCVPLATLVGDAAGCELESVVQQAPGHREKLDALTRWLEARRLESTRMPGGVDERMHASTSLVLGNPPVSVAELALRTGVTRRQLHRDFLRWLGVAPSTYIRLVRLQRALASIAAGVRLAEVSVMYGFADQAHMAREIKAMVGMTPSRLASRLRQMNPPPATLTMGDRLLALLSAHAERQPA